MLVRHKFSALILAACFSFTAGTVTAQALTPLNQEEHINKTLLSAGIADQIRKNCGSVNARMVRVMRRAKRLEQYALDAGYTEPEVRAFLESKDEQNRMIASVDSYLHENGVVQGRQATYCSLGRAEIANDSPIGQLLWAW